MAQSDSEIIAEIHRGRRHRYAELVNRYKDLAMTLAIRMLRNRQDAEECVQDAFVRAYNALGGFEGRSGFGTWLYRIVYNVCLSRIERGKSNFDRVDFDDQLEAFHSTEHSSDIEMSDLIQHVTRIAGSLPSKYATIISLFYLQGLSHEEICEVTKLPVGTVKTHLFRARRLLQKGLMRELQAEDLNI